jgi:hypothetical protein
MIDHTGAYKFLVEYCLNINNYIHGRMRDVEVISEKEHLNVIGIRTSSSSSSALQPWVGFGLPFEGFVTMIFYGVGLLTPRPTSSYPGGPMFSVGIVSLSWFFQI